MRQQKLRGTGLDYRCFVFGAGISDFYDYAYTAPTTHELGLLCRGLARKVKDHVEACLRFLPDRSGSKLDAFPL